MIRSGTDTFVSFVDVLADALDDHEASGNDLAARVHLSRFHFDRVISATGGEPPAAFRRRVLLERAAYRLLTTDRTVLDVAVEAGYSSHEAFTRAFARAYGTSPVVWRRRPTRFQLDAPSDVHFHPPGGLRLPARTKVRTMDLIDSMVEHHAWLVGEMVERAGTLTDDQLDAPIEISVEGVDDDPTMRSLLSRLVGQMAMWNAAIDNRPYDFEVERGESLTSMRTRLAQDGSRFVSTVRDVVEQDRLDETFVDATCDPPRVFSYGGMIAHVLTFAAHRRTLVAGALHDAGVTDLRAAIRWSGSRGTTPLEAPRRGKEGILRAGRGTAPPAPLHPGRRLGVLGEGEHVHRTVQAPAHAKEAAARCMRVSDVLKPTASPRVGSVRAVRLRWPAPRGLIQPATERPRR